MSLAAIRRHRLHLCECGNSTAFPSRTGVRADRAHHLCRRCWEQALAELAALRSWLVLW